MSNILKNKYKNKINGNCIIRKVLKYFIDMTFELCHSVISQTI